LQSSCLVRVCRSDHVIATEPCPATADVCRNITQKRLFYSCGRCLATGLRTIISYWIWGLLQRLLWRVQWDVTRCSWKSADSKEHTASIFRVEIWARQETSRISRQAERSSTYLPRTGGLSPNYTKQQYRKRQCSRIFQRGHIPFIWRSVVCTDYRHLTITEKSEDCCLIVRDVMQSGRNWPTFWRNVLLPSSGQKSILRLEMARSSETISIHQTTRCHV
jgi:hypothetical protein